MTADVRYVVIDSGLPRGSHEDECSVYVNETAARHKLAWVNRNGRETGAAFVVNIDDLLPLDADAQVVHEWHERLYLHHYEHTVVTGRVIGRTISRDSEVEALKRQADEARDECARMRRFCVEAVAVADGRETASFLKAAADNYRRASQRATASKPGMTATDVDELRRAYISWSSYDLDGVPEDVNRVLSRLLGEGKLGGAHKPTPIPEHLPAAATTATLTPEQWAALIWLHERLSSNPFNDGVHLALGFSGDDRVNLIAAIDRLRSQPQQARLDAEDMRRLRETAQACKTYQTDVVGAFTDSDRRAGRLLCSLLESGKFGGGQ